MPWQSSQGLAALTGKRSLPAFHIRRARAELLAQEGLHARVVRVVRAAAAGAPRGGLRDPRALQGRAGAAAVDGAPGHAQPAGGAGKLCDAPIASLPKERVGERSLPAVDCIVPAEEGKLADLTWAELPSQGRARSPALRGARLMLEAVLTKWSHFK